MLIIDPAILVDVLVVLGVPALVFMILLGGAGWWRARRAGGPHVWRFLTSAATGVLLVLGAIALFEAMGAYFRHEPAGLGHRTGMVMPIADSSTRLGLDS